MRDPSSLQPVWEREWIDLQGHSWPSCQSSIGQIVLHTIATAIGLKFATILLFHDSGAEVGCCYRPD